MSVHLKQTGKKSLKKTHIQKVASVILLYSAITRAREIRRDAVIRSDTLTGEDRTCKSAHASATRVYLFVNIISYTTAAAAA